MRVLPILLVAVVAGPAFGQAVSLPDGTTLRADDVRRLEEMNSLAAPLLHAIASESDEEVGALVQGLRGQPLPIERAKTALAGEWKCHMIKVSGGDLPIVVYPPFTCKAGADGTFEKTTGSQRTVGMVHSDGEKLIYAGTGFVADEKPVPYAELPEEVDTGASPQLMPEIGVVEIVNQNNGRIIFPRPYLESDLNVLVLRR